MQIFTSPQLNYNFLSVMSRVFMPLPLLGPQSAIIRQITHHYIATRRRKPIYVCQESLGSRRK